MPHSGGGGSHSGGGHHGGSHHSSSGGGSTRRVSSAPFQGGHPYVVYGRNGKSRIVYSDDANYHAEYTKKEMIGMTVFGSIFMIPGIVEFIIILIMFFSFFHFGVRKTNIPAYVDQSIIISDTLDLVDDDAEKELMRSLEKFRDETGIVPAVEFTTDDMWYYDYTTMENFAYNEYVCTFTDEYHLLIVYSFGKENSNTTFKEFNWESMWGDDLSKTASTADENYLADVMQRNLTTANGDEVAHAISMSFDDFYNHLNESGFRVDNEKLMVIVFMIVHGGVFFFAGFFITKSAIKKYKTSKEDGEITYKIQGEPVILKCKYCDTTYYKGTIGNCHNCGAPLDIE